MTALKVSLPATWPTVPELMTFTTLKHLEACPRRWSLESAIYEDVWSGRGYPPRLDVANLAGGVVHLALELLTRKLLEAGCSGVSDPAATQVMRDIGGFTALLEKCVVLILARHDNNPRAATQREAVTRAIRAQIPELRARTQTLVSRLRLAASPSTRGAAKGGGATRQASRRPLDTGTYAELEVRSETLKWKGKLDLLVLSDDEREIVDFKTGAEHGSHGFQLLAYAVLWWRDTELNPSRSRATKLTLAYRARDAALPVPTEQELAAVEDQMKARSESARLSAADAPPRAQPSLENCRFCSVRHLCDDYWTRQVQSSLDAAKAADERAFVDLDVTIDREHGPSSWDATLRSGAGLQRGQRVLLRATAAGRQLPDAKRLRITDAHLAEGEPEGPAIVTISARSEVFIVDE